MLDNQNEYLAIFLEGTHDQLTEIERELVTGRAPSPDRLQSMFRAAHNLKGAAQTMGFRDMAELAHAMEDAMEILRDANRDPDRRAIDALSDALATLRKMFGEIADLGTTWTNAAPHVERLGGVRGAMCPASKASPRRRSRATPFETSPIGFLRTVTVRFAPNCEMPSVRAATTIMLAERDGRVLATFPDPDAIGDGEILSDLRMLVETPLSEAEIRSALLVTDVSEVIVETWRDRGGMDRKTPGGNSSYRVIDPARPGRTVDLGPDARGKLTPHDSGATSHRTIRIDASTLDGLVNMAADLEIRCGRAIDLMDDIPSGGGDPLTENLAEMKRAAYDLRRRIDTERLLPLDVLFERVPRMAREVAERVGKEIDLTVSSGECRLDRASIKTIANPLVHLIRNCIDHGIETRGERTANGKPAMGRIVLTAREDDGRVVIELTDDGAGMDPDAIRNSAVERGLIGREAADRLDAKGAIDLIFLPGLSTSTEVSEISGRGVGMDIVQSSLARLGAELDVDSVVGRGTRFTIRLPAPRPAIRTLMLQVGDEIFGIPAALMIETVSFDAAAIRIIDGREFVLQRGRTLPIIRLRDLFGCRDGIVPAESRIVIVRAMNDRVCIVADSLIGERELVVDPSERFSGDRPGVSGKIVLDDGRVAFILDPELLPELAMCQKGWANAA